MAEKCTNTSSPVERWINPYPFAPLNHLTVPFSLTETPFAFVAEIFFRLLSVVPGKQDTPSKDGQNSVANRVRAYAPTQTAPEVPSLNRRRRNGMEPRDEGARFELPDHRT